MKKKAVLVAVVLLLSIVACGGSADIEGEIAEPDAVAELSEAEVLKPTATEAPPESTEPPPPTDTPKPTLPPTPVPEPVVFEGSGDSIVNVDKTKDPMIARITGNSCGRYFGVTSIDENNETVDLLVNTTDTYSGVRPVDFYESEWTYRLEVQSTCEWSISFEPLVNANLLTIPGKFDGSNDDVLIMDIPEGTIPDLAKITGNAEGRYFGVQTFGGYGDLLVNTTDPYEGTTILDSDAVLFVITAVGDWSIEVSTK